MPVSNNIFKSFFSTKKFYHKSKIKNLFSANILRILVIFLTLGSLLLNANLAYSAPEKNKANSSKQQKQKTSNSNKKSVNSKPKKSTSKPSASNAKKLR